MAVQYVSGSFICKIFYCTVLYCTLYSTVDGKVLYSTVSGTTKSKEGRAVAVQCKKWRGWQVPQCNVS